MPTVLEVIQSTTRFFEKHGVESARLNAEHLIAHSLGKRKRLDLYMEFDRPLSEPELAPMRELVRARSQGRPLQHILGTVEFFGREFLCDERALIPRPETEQLVELVLSTLNPQLSTRILDVGTGSGVIAITLALENPGSNVTALDQSTEALALAKENASRLNADVAFEQADLLPDDDRRFDVIVANLPYIPTDDIPKLGREVQFDPKSALDGGADGLNVVRALIEKSRSRLDGRMFLEIGHDQAAHVTEIFRAAGYTDIRVDRDYSGFERFVSASNPVA